jgi:uncharacterized membrane protein
MRYERVRNAAILLGAGLGGFLDGIALHQIAHWHQMLSARVPPASVEAMQRNMVADGWFHAGTWALTMAGVLVLWSAVRGPGPLPSMRTLLGYMLVGWGAFNLVEGILNHHLLQLHHVRDLPTHIMFYDWAFLIVSGALVLIGLAVRDGRDRVPAPGTERRVRERRIAYH